MALVIIAHRPYILYIIHCTQKSDLSNCAVSFFHGRRFADFPNEVSSNSTNESNIILYAVEGTGFTGCPERKKLVRVHIYIYIYVYVRYIHVREHLKGFKEVYRVVTVCEIWRTTYYIYIYCTLYIWTCSSHKPFVNCIYIPKNRKLLLSSSEYVTFSFPPPPPHPDSVFPFTF